MNLFRLRESPQISERLSIFLCSVKMVNKYPTTYSLINVLVTFNEQKIAATMVCNTNNQTILKTTRAILQIFLWEKIFLVNYSAL
jgi:hypothetical protein